MKALERELLAELKAEVARLAHEVGAHVDQVAFLRDCVLRRCGHRVLHLILADACAVPLQLLLNCIKLNNTLVLLLHYCLTKIQLLTLTI